MKILVYECKKRTSIKETELETFLDENQIVIIEDKSRSSRKPMSDVIIRDENIVFAFHYLFKGIKKYYISANVQEQNGNNENKIFQVPMSAEEIAKVFENTTEYKQQQSKT